jgi:anti-anti-sigma factor
MEEKEKNKGYILTIDKENSIINCKFIIDLTINNFGELDLHFNDKSNKILDIVKLYNINTLIVDLSDVKYMDSCGLGILISLHISLKNLDKKLYVRRDFSDYVDKIFNFCKLTSYFNFIDEL